ncbi:unnamed protein product [Orchesella dallaii]|uniref:Gustatory receptor n=1 Tax=Orchesella dallaii TaxID=48710 RepID=A0ABP1RUL5_9HEXA
MITELYKLSIQITKALLFYIPHVPLTWSEDYRQFCISYTKWKGALYVASIIDLIVAIAGGNLYVLITRNYFHFGPSLNADQLLIVGFGSGSVIFTQGVFLVLCRRIHVAIIGINSVFSLAEEMTRRYRPNEITENGMFLTRDGKDTIGTVACFIALFAAISPLTLSMFFLWHNLDPLDIALEDALPDAKYWSWSTILLVFSIRFICVQIGMAQGLQIILTMASMAGGGIWNLMHCMQILLNDIESEEEFLDFYIRFGLAFKLLRVVLDDLVLIVLTAAHWGFALGIWLCISGYNKISLIMYVALVFGIGSGFIAMLVAFRKFKMGIEMADEILEKRRLEARMKFVDMKTKRMKIISRRLNALTVVLQLRFGSFYPLTTEYFMEFINGLMAQVVDFLVVFK